MTRISFHQLCTLTAAIWAMLALTLLVWPAVIHWLFAIDSVASTDIMSRRAGVLFAGLATIVWMARTAPDSPLRRSICFGFSVAMGGYGLPRSGRIHARRSRHWGMASDYCRSCLRSYLPSILAWEYLKFTPQIIDIVT